MSMAGLEGNKFYFQDKDGKRIEVFSIEEVSKETQELPLDILMVPKEGNRCEVFLQRLLSCLKCLGKGENALGQSLIVLSLAKQLNATAPNGDFLLLGECVTSPFAQALAMLIECFSLDSRLYCLVNGEGGEAVKRSSMLPMPQTLDSLSLPSQRFCCVIMVDRDQVLPVSIVDKAISAVRSEGKVFCLSSGDAVKQSFLSLCPSAEQYLIDEHMILCYQAISEDFVQKRYSALYPGFSMEKPGKPVYVRKKQNIIFMPYAYSQWKKMKPVYEQLMNEKDKCNAFILPLPYGEKDEQGAVIKWHYDGEKFISEGIVLDFRTVDFPALQPDVLVLSHAYDSHEKKYTVEDVCYAANLCRVAKKMICLSAVNNIDDCLRGGGML